mmetsp:Transcript_7556/g.9313  ORF Transcript_7556/g.9313 Transcript_7556/m.9313 type:complete len:344 (-) Transcript_7556:65-1096(-)
MDIDQLEPTSNKVILIDATTDSITISWPPPPEKSSAKYILEYRGINVPEFVTLSSSVSATQAKKKNLKSSDGPFFFRVRPIGINEWMGHLCPFELTTKDEESLRMPPPNVDGGCGGYCVVVKWEEFTKGTFKVEGYELQMRELNPGGNRWVTVAPFIRGTEARKRNLKEGVQYQFRIMPAKTMRLVKFSSPSEAVSVTALAPGVTELFKGLPHNCLIQPDRSHIGLEAALGNKVILLFASARWCQPSRIYTPQLFGFYNSNKSDVEIIYVSCDHNESEFQIHFSSMPWKAVPYGIRLRERLLAKIQIKNIPRLVVLNRQGEIMVENAQTQKLDVASWKNNPKF